MIEEYMDKKEFSKYKHAEMYEEYAKQPQHMMPQPQYPILQANPVMVKYLADKIIETQGEQNMQWRQ